MNDFDKLISIIDGKVEFGVEQNGHEDQYPEATKQITMLSSKGFGYERFLSDWLFDKDGKLIAVGY